MFATYNMKRSDISNVGLGSMQLDKSTEMSSLGLIVFLLKPYTYVPSIIPSVNGKGLNFFTTEIIP